MTEKVQQLNIYQRINKIMEEVECVQKGSVKVNNQYKFVSHDAVTAALHKPMVKHGVVMKVSTVELLQNGNRTEAKILLTFVNIDNPSDNFEVFSYGYGIDSQDKGVGKAISYAVKYGMLKTFCLETGDDVEKNLVDYRPADVDPAISQNQVDLLESIINGHGDIRAKMLVAYKGDLGNILQRDFTKALEKVKRLIGDKQGG